MEVGFLGPSPNLNLSLSLNNKKILLNRLISPSLLPSLNKEEECWIKITKGKGL